MRIKKIKPLFTRIVTTMDMYVEDQYANPGHLIDVSKLKKGIKEYQRVISVGTSVRNVKEGDLVCINPDRYAVRQFQEDSMKADLMVNQIVSYNFNVVKLEDKEYLLLDEADIEFVVEDYDED